MDIIEHSTDLIRRNKRMLADLRENLKYAESEPERKALRNEINKLKFANEKLERKIISIVARKAKEGKYETFSFDLPRQD